MVARYGGDEFIALLPGAPLHAAENALNRAVSAVAALPHDLSHGVTLSVGVVTLRPQESATRALARADAAMYQAKRQGGNGVVSAAPSTGATGTHDPDSLAATTLTTATTDPSWALPDGT
jgi:diguanylate cyclase (GGDEF)-like protein